MKPRLLVSLLICASLLAGCYRQAEEPFQPIDSAEVVAEATSAVVVVEDAIGGDRSAEADTGPTVEPGIIITPEPLPGQVDMPTVEMPTSAAVLGTLTPFVISTATPSFEEQLDPNDECVYQVQAGNVLFRLALAWGTTYQTIMEVNQMDSEDLSIGQLLLIPDCEPEASAAELAVTAGAVDVAAGDPAPADAEPTGRPEIHVVSAGETIESISLRYRVDVNDLIALNELTDRNRLSVGQELKLPPE